MTENLMLKDGDSAYAPASATKRTDAHGNVCAIGHQPSKDPETIAKWDYYKTLIVRSEHALQITKEIK